MESLQQVEVVLTLAFVCLAASISLAEATPGAYDGPKKDLHVYVLCGDATMADRTKLSDEPATPLDRCYLLNDKGEWEPARPPLNRYSTVIEKGREQGLTPGYGFAKAMLAKNEKISIGLVVNATSGTRIEDWQMKSPYYRGIRGRTRTAMKTGTLKGILWHHGGRSFSVSRLDDLKTMIAYLRSDLGDLDLPFVAGQVTGNPVENNLLAALAESVHATGIAGAEGLTTAEDGRLTPEGIEAFGARYAEEMLASQAACAARAADREERTMPLIDSHMHIHDNRKDGLEIVAGWMAANRIERCIVQTLGPSRPKNEEERRFMRANYRKHADRIYRFCIIEPDEVADVDEAVAILEREKTDGAIGFGEHYGREMMFDDPRNMRLYAACEKVGLPVMFHIDQDKNMDGLDFPHLRRALEAYPDCIFIAHAQWWLQFPSGVCDRMLQEYPNLYAEPSGLRMSAMLNRDRRYTREFLIRNADKVLFGSDAGWWSISDGRAKELQFALFEKLDLPDDVKRKIYSENAEALFDFW